MNCANRLIYLPGADSQVFFFHFIHYIFMNWTKKNLYFLTYNSIIIYRSIIIVWYYILQCYSYYILVLNDLIFQKKIIQWTRLHKWGSSYPEWWWPRWWLSRIFLSFPWSTIHPKYYVSGFIRADNVCTIILSLPHTVITLAYVIY